MSVLFAVDLLGTRARWRAGAGAAARGFAAFEQLITETAAGIEAAPELLGEIDADWCAIHCPSREAALAVARRIFRRAWLAPRNPEDPRLWLRGVIGPGDEDARPREATDSPELPGMRLIRYGPATLAALAVLRSGFRGMRILVAESLLDDDLRGRFRIPVGRLGVIPFRRMNHTPYPGVAGSSFHDFLWMAEAAQDWGQYVGRMKQRVLWSARDPEESAQAAATQVVFHETDAILQSVLRKSQQRRDDGYESGADPDRDV